jgi:hypothetical protein
VKTFSLEEIVERDSWLGETRQRRVSGVVGDNGGPNS